MGMPLPNSFSYNNQLHRVSSSKVHPPQPINSSVHGDSQIPPQTLNHYPLYRDLDPEIDPGSASVGGATANRSSSSPKSPPPPPPPTSQPQPVSFTDPLVRYRECLKNHAARMGAHVVDGCGEFMPSGEEGTVEAFKCAACECHRNFHRKEINGESQYAPPGPSRCNTKMNSVVNLQQPTPLSHQRFSLGLSVSTPSTAVPVAPVMMNFGGGGGAAESSSEDLNMFHPGGQSSHDIIPQSSKKRFRTKFSEDQKDKMMEFAEKLGWRIQKQDEQELQQFCAQVRVKRQKEGKNEDQLDLSLAVPSILHGFSSLFCYGFGILLCNNHSLLHFPSKPPPPLTSLYSSLFYITLSLYVCSERSLFVSDPEKKYCSKQEHSQTPNILWAISDKVLVLNLKRGISMGHVGASCLGRKSHHATFT
ncbi:hypothetical protein V6N13_053250 [Hibiscus sabdariffa]|uniref:Uncharacterized protein n=2 Tax=Hibiscus sabdariffa TaxID=183260 RepID=A0ABR2ATR2_9ROSI